MAAGVIRNFHLQSAPTRYFPVILHQFPSEEKREEEEEEEEVRDGITQAEEYREEEEEDDDDDDGNSEAFEEDEEEDDWEEFALSPAPHPSAVTSQLLRFADLISRDVQRYFGRCPEDQAARDVYNDSVSVKAGGRLRYYDDLLRMARTGSPEESEPAPVSTTTTTATAKELGVWVTTGNSSLGPLAELFHQRGQSQARPMSKRHLPLSFWTEPIPCCAVLTLSSSPGCSLGDAHVNSSTLTRVNEHTNHGAHTQYSTHTPDHTHPDFSDLLANWDPHPELTHTLTDNTQTL